MPVKMAVASPGSHSRLNYQRWLRTTFQPKGCQSEQHPGPGCRSAVPGFLRRRHCPASSMGSGCSGTPRLPEGSGLRPQRPHARERGRRRARRRRPRWSKSVHVWQLGRCGDSWAPACRQADTHRPSPSSGRRTPRCSGASGWSATAGSLRCQEAHAERRGAAPRGGRPWRTPESRRSLRGAHRPRPIAQARGARRTASPLQQAFEASTGSAFASLSYRPVRLSGNVGRAGEKAFCHGAPERVATRDAAKVPARDGAP